VGSEMWISDSTHILVGMGAAVFTLISGYAFGATASTADRIAAQVVSGFGFIGGGAILRDRGDVKGLTTAAGLWAVAALGMAAGAGLFTIGALGTVIILVTLIALRSVEQHLPRRIVDAWTIQITLARGASIGAMRDALEAHCRSLTLEGLSSDEDTHVTFAVEMPHNSNIDTLNGEIRAAGAQCVVWHATESASLDRGV